VTGTTKLFDTGILSATQHRPWPMPDRRWIMTQSWHDLLFAHWRVNPSVLRSKVPKEFGLDLFDGEAWIGVVPFYMTNVSLRGTPALPWVSAFPELNVRTYVRVGDRPGIYFFSLDAGRWLAVRAARMWLNLPYYSATMAVGYRSNIVTYRSERTDGDAKFVATYAPSGPPALAPRGSLEHFLTERYCLYHRDHKGTPYRLDIHHPPWLLQRAEAEVLHNSMAAASQLVIDAGQPVLHFVKRQDMIAWTPESL
jgi:uncharacterized protein YqjF (DUF2071 family)